MLPALKSYLIREHVGVFKMHGTYDIFNPEDNSQIAIAQEKKGMMNVIAGMFMNKRMLPTRIDVHEGADVNGPILFSIRRGFSLFRPTVEVLGADGTKVGSLKTRLLTIGGKFGVYDASGNEVATVKGNWLSWDFRFIAANGEELGMVSKEWSGFAKELFTSADNYVVTINHPSSSAAILLLAAGLAVDTVYKEDSGGGGLDIG